jgi:DNA (cytosine-5)-methyltransferase 1
VTFGDAIGDLPVDGCAEGEKLRPTPVPPYANQLRASDLEVHDHQPWRYGTAIQDAIAGVPEGGSFGPGRSAGYYSQAYTRLHREGLARTVTTTPAAGASRTSNHRGPGRGLRNLGDQDLDSTRGGAPAGIPDGFPFIRFATWQERLVGNAYPQIWARQTCRTCERPIGAGVSGLTRSASVSARSTLARPLNSDIPNGGGRRC